MPDGTTIYYCSDWDEWRDGPCGPECPGDDHRTAMAADPRLTILRLVKAVRHAYWSLDSGDGAEAMERLKDAYVSATDHDI